MHRQEDKATTRENEAIQAKPWAKTIAGGVFYYYRGICLKRKAQEASHAYYCLQMGTTGHTRRLHASFDEKVFVYYKPNRAA